LILWYATEKGHEIWYRECNKPHNSGSLITVASELARYKLELVGVQVVSGIYLFSLENETNIFTLEQDFLFTTKYYRQLRK